ncbi:MAG: flagellar basal body rod protein FlgC [Fibrobacterales bacterium]
MPLVGMFTGLNISATGLRAQRVRQNVIASNLANAETTRTDEGGPYKKQTVIFEADPEEYNKKFVFGPPKLQGKFTHENHMDIPDSEFVIDREYIGSGVKVAEIHQDENAPRLVYDPKHPDANKEGYVAMPNINVVQEMTDMISATRAYEANVTAFSSTKAMLMEALKL